MLNKILSHHGTIRAEHNHHDTGSTKIFGFWIYLMSDCVLFATLFATYAVLHHNVAGGPTGKSIFELQFVLLETLLLLFSSITYSMAILAMYHYNKNWVNIWLSVTCLFGLCFISMEFYEFYYLINKNYGPDHSAFLSSFFTLVGTHGLHVISGIIWILVMIVHVYRRGLTTINQIRLQCLSLFWHFLDIIWICVFTVVYLLGVL